MDFFETEEVSENGQVYTALFLFFSSPIGFPDVFGHGILLQTAGYKCTFCAQGAAQRVLIMRLQCS